LQKLDILKLALTNARKYSLCMVLGAQDFSQVYEIYGHDPGLFDGFHFQHAQTIFVRFFSAPTMHLMRIFIYSKTT
jgi:hypothetical protein